MPNLFHTKIAQFKNRLVFIVAPNPDPVIIIPFFQGQGAKITNVTRSRMARSVITATEFICRAFSAQWVWV
jgi:hypothetical protein